MNNELIQKAAEALDIALGRTGVFNPPELDFMSAAYDGLVAALQTSLPHEPQVPIVWARQKDINATMIATVGERAEVAPDREPGFTVPLYLHPSTAQTSLPQDVEEWIAENEFRDSWGVNAIYTSDLRAFLAGKVLVPVEPTEQMVEAGCRQHICEQQDPWYSSTEISEFDCRAIYSAMLTASKGE